MFREIFKITFNHILDWIILFVSVFMPVIVACVGLPQSEIKEKIYIIIIFILFTLFFYTVKLYLNTLYVINSGKVILPKLKLIKNDYFIFEPSKLYSPQMLVSLYYSGNDFEKVIGYGIIETVISNTKNLQVKILKFQGEDVNNYFFQKNKVNIILKPSVPFHIVEEISKEKENINA